MPLNKISPNVIKAVLSIEDSKFYEHGALDLSSVIRAIGANIRAGHFVQGGSTITQQLVKNTLGSRAPTLERKFKELALAERVEQHYSKDQILELYLNDVFLGNNVYGVGTAARFYFHESAANLNLAQSALLAGLIQSPSYDDPIAHRRHAFLRRNDVLNRMIDLGPAGGGVSAKRGDAAKLSKIKLRLGGNYVPTPPFLVDYVRQEIVNDPNGWFGVLGNTPQDRENTMKEGGLDIITTLDPDWQKAAQKAANQPWALHRPTPATAQSPTSRSCRSRPTPARPARCSRAGTTRSSSSTSSRRPTSRGRRSSPTCWRRRSSRGSRRPPPSRGRRARWPGATTPTGRSGT